MNGAIAVVEARNLTKHFPVGFDILGRPRAWVHALDEVSLEVRKGEAFGLVGESGCGKSTLGHTLIRLVEPTSGSVHFDGEALTGAHGERLRQLRRRMQIVFQDPFGSLDPRQKIGDIVAEPLRAHGLARGRDLEDRVTELLLMVGLDPSLRDRHPHRLSGGQRQRVSIARALAPDPHFVVADEAVSALDVSIQSQILNLFMDLQARLNLTYLFIAHGLNVVRHLSDRVGVMYLGELVEVAPTDTLFENFAHPYTAALISAIPPPDPRHRRRRIVLRGDVPSAINPPSGCRFHTRCPIARERCRLERPQLRQLAPGHSVACHFPVSPDVVPELAASGQRKTTQLTQSGGRA